jgi:GcrA cell cycle regulator
MKGEEWPEAAIECLRTLWDAGMSATQIGRHMSRTKCSIVGKAHRLHLKSRLSPIKRNGSSPPIRPYSRRLVRVAGQVTLAPLLALLDDPILLTTPPRERPAPKPKPVAEVPRTVRRSNRQCEWLDSDKPFQRCEAFAWPGYPYCSVHCGRAYINWRGAAADGELVA